MQPPGSELCFFYSCCMCLHDRPITRLAPKIDLLQAIQIQLCKYIILRIVQKEMSLVIDPRQGNELAFSYGKSQC